MSDESPATVGSRLNVPQPAHPHRRREPLPWHEPKPAQDDPDAPRRVQAILESASYGEADRDVEFLQHDDTRGLRLQLDYLKPEFRMAGLSGLQWACAATMVYYLRDISRWVQGRAPAIPAGDQAATDDSPTAARLG